MTRSGAGPTPLTFTTWFEATAGHDKDRVALIDVTGSWTYGDVWEAARAVASGLVARGLRPAEPVTMAMTPSAGYFAAYLGVILAGGVATPVNTRLTPPEVRAFLDRIGSQCTIYDAPNAHLITAGKDDVELAISDGPMSLRTQLDALWAEAGALPELDESAPAVIFPTGGTTGLPKGAWTSHRGLTLWVWNVAFGGRRHRHEVELYFSPFFHVSLIVGMLAPLFAGGTVVIERSFDAGSAIEAIQTHGVTRLMGAPTMFTALGDHPAAQTTGALHQIRDLIYGAAPATDAFVRKLRADFPNAALQHGYGSTEFASGVTRIDFDEIKQGHFQGVGRPNPGCEIRILGPDGASLPAGEIGEVAVRSPWQTLGYWNQPEETAATYGEDGFIRLGDLGFLDETGWLTISGRKKEMIISGGENVFPIEVEQQLTAQPGVAEAVAFGVPDERWGERVEAVVTARPGFDVDVEALRAALRLTLAGYKVPKRIHLIDAVPLTGNNKPDRRRLQERYSAAN